MHNTQKLSCVTCAKRSGWHINRTLWTTNRFIYNQIYSQMLQILFNLAKSMIKWTVKKERGKNTFLHTFTISKCTQKCSDLFILRLNFVEFKVSNTCSVHKLRFFFEPWNKHMHISEPFPLCKGQNGQTESSQVVSVYSGYLITDRSRASLTLFQEIQVHRLGTRSLKCKSALVFGVYV